MNRDTTIVIATRNRLVKLLNTLKTIPLADWISVCVVCDDDEETFQYLRQYRPDVEAILTDSHIGSVACRNMAISKIDTHVLYATDDLLFRPQCIDRAMGSMREWFPDYDGVIGIKQEPGGYHPSGVALVGQPFLQRYPERQLFCPDYWHFSAHEVMWHAEAVERFHLEEGATFWHLHPAKFKEEMDETHREGRIHKDRDMALIAERKNNNLIWGLR